MKRTWLMMMTVSIAGGCAASVNETKTPLVVAAFKPGAGQSQGIGIGIQPITAANIRNFHDLNTTTTWYEGDPNAPTEAKRGSGQRSSAQIKRVLVLPLVPFPAAKIRIINQSGKPLPLSQLQLALKDGAGKSFPAFGDITNLQARVVTELLQSQPGMRRGEIESQVAAGIGKIPYAAATREIANGENWTGYVAFDMAATPDVDGYLRTATGLTLVAAGMPELQVPLTKTDVELVLLCPPGQRTPTLNRCHEEEHDEKGDEKADDRIDDQQSDEGGGASSRHR